MAQVMQIFDNAEYRELKSYLRARITMFCMAGHMRLHENFHMQVMQVYVKQ